MIEIVYRPIDHWPGEPTPERQRSPFSAKYEQTRELLDRELRHLDAQHVVLQVALDEKDFRVNGEIKVRAVASHPGVILAFDSKHGPLKYACDRFLTWDDNVRAIALGLEALRRVDRYGIGNRHEQYTGWKQLPAGIAMGEPMTKPEAARVLVDLADPEFVTGTRPLDLLADLDAVEEMWRIAARAHHPDRGGDADLFARAREAHDTLTGANA